MAIFCVDNEIGTAHEPTLEVIYRTRTAGNREHNVLNEAKGICRLQKDKEKTGKMDGSKEQVTNRRNRRYCCSSHKLQQHIRPLKLKEIQTSLENTLRLALCR